MKYLNFICYSLLLMLLFNTSSLYAAPPLTDHTTHTPLSLMPEPLSGSRDTFSLAATWWLPDWQGGQGTRGSDDDGGGDVEGECETYGFVTECPPPKTSGGLTYPLSGLTCHKSCSCSEDFKYNSSNCSGNYKLSGSSCDGKYSACVCKDEFRYDSSNCNGENKLGGEICNGKYNSCTLRPECTVSSKDCTYGCAEYNSCDRCISCNGNPDCDVSDKSCTYGCASYNSCSKCTSCKDNPDCSATAVSCDYGCASTNSCGICTSCSGNPDCDVADKSCDYGCASTNSCGKCTECKSCTPYSDETGCTDGTESCSDGCGGTRLCCKDHTHSYSCPSGYSTSNAGMISPVTADKVCSCGAASGTCYKEGHSHSYSCPSGYQESSCSSSQVQTETTSKVCSCGAASGTCYSCRAKNCTDYGYTDSPRQGYNCTQRFVAELSQFCYTDLCKICEKGVVCNNGCAKYNYGENMADVFGCPRVCLECATQTQNCSSGEVKVTCNGQDYCCGPRYASCYYTEPHDQPDGTTTILCRPLLSSVSSETTATTTNNGTVTEVIGPSL